MLPLILILLSNAALCGKFGAQQKICPTAAPCYISIVCSQISIRESPPYWLKVFKIRLSIWPSGLQISHLDFIRKDITLIFPVLGDVENFFGVGYRPSQIIYSANISKMAFSASVIETLLSQPVRIICDFCKIQFSLRHNEP